MRAAQPTRWLAVAALALVPLGCANEGTVESSGSGSGGPSTTVAAPPDHDGDHGTTTIAPTTTIAAPTRLDVVATEYAWTGLPDELPAGTYPMTFMNEGTEAHEVSIFRNTNGLGLDELFELGPVGIKSAVEMVGTLISGPGTPAEYELTIELTAGEYEVVCFVPASSDMQPHFAHGMHQKLVVR